MIKEYFNFIKDYLKLTQVNKLYLAITLITAILYKVFLLLMPLFASCIIKYIAEGNTNMMYISLLLLALSYLLYDLSMYINYKVYGKNINYSYCKLQTRILDKLTKIDDSFTKQISKGKLLNSVNRDIIDVGDMVEELSELVGSFVQLIVFFVIVANYSLICCLLILVYCIIYIISRNVADKKSDIFFRKQKNNEDQYSSLFSQVLNGMQEIKTFNIVDKLEKKLEKIKSKFSSNYTKCRKYITFRDNDVRFITHLFKIILYLLVVYLVFQGKLTIDVLVLLVAYFESIIIYMDDFITATSTIRAVNVSVERLNNILNYEPNEIILYGTCDNDYINGIVEFKNVSFSYSNKKIIKNLSLKVKSNSLTTIVGQSGTGKTSIINLLLRLYKVDSGKILIDGVNIYDYTKDIYFSNVSVVNQKPFIFNMSIRKNLDFINTNIEHQIAACKRVGIHDFIVSLPNGYNTILKENANNISGGQKQLISLARTLLSKSEILLFDEITSSLDPDTSKHISDLLGDLKKDHTIIMITHKPDLMKKSDRIIVLHEGKIVGDGTHNTLIANNEHYQWLQARKSVSKLGVFD